MIEEIPIRSWSELQERLFEDSWNPEIHRFRSRQAFRGLSDATYPLSTALMRLDGKYAELERHILRNFRKYAFRAADEGESLWHWLSLAQHHGLPTRLMDWTYSPFVALHFATANIERYDCDGAIWSIDYTKAHQLLPEVLRKSLELEGANVFTVQALSENLRDLEHLDSLWPETFILFMEPPSLDDRIINQFAFFSILSDAQQTLDQWLLNHPDIAKKYIIPRELKWEFRDKLDQANITERVLFPGLDGLSRWLKRHYSPWQDISDASNLNSSSNRF